MTPYQKLQIRMSDVRKRLSELGGIETLTDEHRSEIETLRTEYGDLETRSVALTIGGDVPETTVTESTSEDRELTEIRSAVNFGEYIAAAMAGHGVTQGPEFEYNQALGMGTDRFPMELLARGLEDRAARDGDAATMQQTWIDRVFQGTAAASLGISFRNVAPGISAYPVTTAGGESVQRGRTEAVAESTYTFNVTEIKPTRNAVHGIYSIEDDARLPGMSEAIQRDMRAAMVEKIDRTVFLGDTGANENIADITGLTTAAIGETTVTQAQKVKGDELLKKFLAYVDGQYAAMLSDLSVVATVGSNVLWYGTIHNTVASNQTVAQFLMENGVNWTVRGGIESNTANDDFGAFIGLNRGMDGAGVAAVWDQGQLITDPYTSADKGEVKLTLNYLWGIQYPRTANFKRLKYVT